MKIIKICWSRTDGKIKISQKLWMKNMTGILLQKFRKRMTDGTWETVKEDTETDQAEELKGNFSVSNLGTYRIRST